MSMYAPLKNIPATRNWTLDELNGEKMKILLPAIVYTFSLMIIGTVGNATVLFIYFNRCRPSSHRCFILALGTCDLITCVICMPFTLANELSPYNFTNVAACKIFRSTTFFTSGVSMMLLFVISIERYRKVCFTFCKQLTLAMAKKTISGVFFVGLILSLPPGFIFGHNTIHTGFGNVSGATCHTDDSLLESNFPYMYNCILVTLTFIQGFVIVFCYAKIAHKYLSVQSKQMRSGHKLDAYEPVSSLNDRDVNVSALHELTREYLSHKDKAPSHLSNNKCTDIKSIVINNDRTQCSDVCVDVYVLKQTSVDHSNPEDFSFSERENDDCKENRKYIEEHDNTTIYIPSGKNYLNEADLKETGAIKIADADNLSLENHEESKIRNIKQKRHTYTYYLGKGKKEDQHIMKSSEIETAQINSSHCFDPAVAKKKRFKNRHASYTRRKCSKSAKDVQRREKTILSVTKMSFVISVVYFCSFTPHFVLTSLMMQDKNFVDKMNPETEAVFQILLRSFLINAVANPFVYNVMDIKFRHQLGRFCKIMLCKS